MSPALALIQSAHSQASTTVSSITATLTSMPTAGDILIACAYSQGQKTMTPPSGWTKTVSVNSAMDVFWYVVPASPTTTYAFTSSAADYLALSIREYSGANTTTPFAGTAGASTNFPTSGPYTFAVSASPTIAGTLPLSCSGVNTAIGTSAHTSGATEDYVGYTASSNTFTSPYNGTEGQTGTIQSGTSSYTTTHTWKYTGTGSGGPYDTTFLGFLSPATSSVPANVKVYGGYYCSTTYNSSACYHGYTYVSPTQLASWATYAEPDGNPSDFAALETAGMPHVLDYIDPNIYVSSGGGGCIASREVNSDFLPGTGATPITTWQDGSGSYYWNLNAGSSALAYIEAQALGCITSSGATGAMLDDLLAAADQYGNTLLQTGVPSMSAWTADEQALWSSLSGKDVVVNGVGWLNAGPSVDSYTMTAINASTVLGALEEGCYLNGSTNTAEYDEYHSWGNSWQATENDEIQTEAVSKDFICLGYPYNGANTSFDRLYYYASLLLTFDPNHSVYWSQGLPTADRSVTNTNIYPEVQIYPTAPLVTQPASISSLATGSVYVREYNACYDAGTYVGGCEVVVNPTESTQNIPTSASSSPATPSGRSYTHQLTVAGNDVFGCPGTCGSQSGVAAGTLSIAGTAPSSLPAVSGAVLFP